MKSTSLSSVKTKEPSRGAGTGGEALRGMMQRNRHGEAEREKARHTETTLPSLANTDPTVCSPPLAMVTKHLFGCFGLSLRKGCGSGGKAKCVQDCANGDAPGAQQTQESPLQFITGCVLTGHTG